MNSEANDKQSNVLLIGDVEKAFLDAENVDRGRCRVYRDVHDGMEEAEKSSYGLVGLVMSTTSSDIMTVLKTLRRTTPHSKIILLAQMHEEPQAMRLMQTTKNGRQMADDYLICPMRFSRLLNSSAPFKTVQVKKPEKVIQVTPPKPSVQETPFAESELLRKVEYLEKLATEDDLTGLKNRRYIFEFCRQIIEYAGRQETSVTLLVFDIDDFKHYNDLYGHSAGDEILKQAGVLMKRCCRNHDIVGRIGGDEFVVIFWDNQTAAHHKEAERRSAESEQPKEAIFISKRFRTEFNKADLNMLGPSGKGSLTISGGLASFPRDADSTEMLFKKADQALLEAKKSGKNRIYLVGRPDNDIAEL